MSNELIEKIVEILDRIYGGVTCLVLFAIAFTLAIIVEIIQYRRNKHDKHNK